MNIKFKVLMMALIACCFCSVSIPAMAGCTENEGKPQRPRGGDKSSTYISEDSHLSSFPAMVCCIGKGNRPFPGQSDNGIGASMTSSTMAGCNSNEGKPARPKRGEKSSMYISEDSYLSSFPVMARTPARQPDNGNGTSMTNSTSATEKNQEIKGIFCWMFPGPLYPTRPTKSMTIAC